MKDDVCVAPTVDPVSGLGTRLRSPSCTASLGWHPTEPMRCTRGSES